MVSGNVSAMATLVLLMVEHLLKVIDASKLASTANKEAEEAKHLSVR